MSTVNELDLAIQEVDALLSQLLKGSDPKQLSSLSVQQSKPSTSRVHPVRAVDV